MVLEAVVGDKQMEIDDLRTKIGDKQFNIRYCNSLKLTWLARIVVAKFDN